MLASFCGGRPSVFDFAVEPLGAAVLSGGLPDEHQMPGIGVGLVPKVLNRAILDEVVVVIDAEAFVCSRRLAREQGIVAGVSSGASVHSSLTIAARLDWAGRTVVTVICDTGERYITTALFDGT